MKPSVFLADLRHNYSGVLANDCMPLGVAYMKAVMDRDLPEVTSRLLCYPDRLSQALRETPPDVLMVSNYVWNEALSLHYLRLAKKLNPAILTVMGGPNICIEDDRQIAYMRAHPEIDVYVLGEGDFLAAEVIRRFLTVDGVVERLGSEPLPSCLYRDSDGQVRLQKMWGRHREVDEIPSVWLTGILDEFFDGKLAPMIETNRGCPFTCTFCVQGTGWYTKVHNFEVDRIRDEIDYIARRVKAVCPSMGTMRIADSNYGMFERDVEISAYIGEAQKKYGWPTFIDATTGKNRPERIIQSLEKVSGALVLYQAVQSLDEATLKNIKRSTIKLETYEQIQIHVRGRGLRSNSDLILGLPGETLETHLRAIGKLVDAGTSEMHNFQSMLLKGSEMETLEAREVFKFDSRLRVLPKNFGVYDGEKVFDMDEIVVATGSMPFADYLAARTMHLVCSVFWNNGWFTDAIECAKSFGIAPSRWLQAILSAMQRDEGVIRQFLQRFIDETTEELFPTPEACTEFYAREENFERLKRGEVGDNLMYKYRAVASFELWPHICRVAMNATRDLVLEARPDLADGVLDEFWADFGRHVEHTHAHGCTLDQLLTPIRTDSRYDLPNWIADGYPETFADYRLTDPTPYLYELPVDASAELTAALEVWTLDPKGLSKLVTRVRPRCQVRQRLPFVSPTATSRLTIGEGSGPQSIGAS